MDESTSTKLAVFALPAARRRVQAMRQSIRLASASTGRSTDDSLRSLMLANQVTALAPKEYRLDAVQEFPAVPAAVRLIGDELASMEAKLVRGLNGKTEEVSPFDPEHRIVVDQWGWGRDRATSGELIAHSLLYYGFAAVLVVRDPLLRGLRVLHPGCLGRTEQGGFIKYTYSGTDAPFDLGLDPDYGGQNALAWVELSADFSDGLPVQPFRRVWPSFRLAIAASRFAAKYFEAGAQGNVAWTQRVSEPGAGIDEAVSDDLWAEMDRMRQRGAREFVAPPELEPHSIGSNAQEAQVVALLDHGIRDVGRIMGVPAMVLQELSRGTFSNYGQALRFFARFTLRSLARKLQAALNTAIWPTGNTRLVFDVQDLGAETPYETSQRLALEVTAGARTQNEMRAAIGLPVLLPGDEGYYPELDTPARTSSFPFEALGMAPDREPIGEAEPS